ncbi:MAG: acyl carrier protein [Planctomycetota bacterium]
MDDLIRISQDAGAELVVCEADADSRVGRGTVEEFMGQYRPTHFVHCTTVGGTAAGTLAELAESTMRQAQGGCLVLVDGDVGMLAHCEQRLSLSGARVVQVLSSPGDRLPEETAALVGDIIGSPDDADQGQVVHVDVEGAERRGRVERTIRRVLGLAANASLSGAALGSTEGWDSLHHIELVLSLESEFGIRVSAEDIERTRDATGLVDLVLRS